MVDIIGSTAGFLTIISFLPQIIKTYRTKKAKDISLMMFLIIDAGAILWTIYGILLYKWPIIITNSLVFVLCLFITIMKIKYK